MLLITLPQNIRSGVKCCDYWEKQKVRQIIGTCCQLSICCPLFRVLKIVKCKCKCKIVNVVKLKLFGKPRNLLLCVTLSSQMVLRFKKSNKFQFVQAAKTIKYEDAAKGSNFKHANQFCSFLKF